jgi:large subunit ribosomal protein L9
MEIILKQDVKNLGYKDEVVKVRAGYGRNYLIPKGMASLADDNAKKVLAENLKQRSFKEEKVKKEAEVIAGKLKDLKVKVGAKVGEKGKIFGSVNALQIADAIKKMGFDVDRKNVQINDEAGVKTTGSYTADVRLHKDVIVKVAFEVIEE